MDHNEVKHKFAECAAFRGTDEVSRAMLFWRGTVMTVVHGSLLYAQGDPLDECFYLVLSGQLAAEQNGSQVGTISDGQIFGEMAFLNPIGTRSATIRAVSNPCVLLRFKLTQAELSSQAFRPLREYFKSEAWTRIVSNAQAAT